MLTPKKSDQQRIIDDLLLAAVRESDYDRIALCLKKGADINARTAAGNTPIMIMAAWNDSPYGTEYLLKHKPDLLLKNNGKTVFEIVSEKKNTGHKKILTLLIGALPDKDAEAAPEAENASEKNPVALAEDTPAAERINLKPHRKKSGGLNL